MFEYIGTYWIFGLGFFAQGLFGIRILVQWWFTGKRRQIVSPGLFWKISLAGASLFLIYGGLSFDFVIILGQTISYFIYIRNLQLKEDWNKVWPSVRFLLLTFPFFTLAWALFALDKPHLSPIASQQKSLFLWFGTIGQILLNVRFIYQLYYSEQHRESILPVGFWWISLTGSMLVVVYAICRRDPVLLVAQGIAIIPYTRNLVLSKKKCP